MKYVLNNSLMVHELEDGELLISVTGKDLFSVYDRIDDVLEIMCAFLEPRTYSEAYSVACESGHILENDFQECFEFMRDNNILKEGNRIIELDHYESEKYKRQISAFNSLPGIELCDACEMQRKINNSHVCVIGMGGTGSYFALAMAAMGVGKLTIVDYDEIELSNTSRQILYDESDVGKKKTDVAKEKLEKYNARINITIVNSRIESTKDIECLGGKDIDLLVLCADTPRGKIQYIIDSFAKENGIPWFMYGPYNHSKISIGPLILPDSGKTYEQIFPRNTIKTTNDKVQEINDKFVASICDAFNGFASQFAAVEALKILTNYKETLLQNRNYLIDTDVWEIEYVDY